MLQFITPGILKEVIRLRRKAHAAEQRKNAGRPIWEDFSKIKLPQWTPEELAFRDFLRGLSHDVLIELQSLFWLGTPRTPKSKLKQRLRHLLQYSRSNDDHIVSYLFGKNIILAEAIEHSLMLLGW